MVKTKFTTELPSCSTSNNSMKAWDALDENLKDAYAALPPPVRKASGFPYTTQKKERLRLGGRAAKRVTGLTESQKLSAREAAKPHSHTLPRCGTDFIAAR